MYLTCVVGLRGGVGGNLEVFQIDLYRRTLVVVMKQSAMFIDIMPKVLRDIILVLQQNIGKSTLALNVGLMAKKIVNQTLVVVLESGADS